MANSKESSFSKHAHEFREKAADIGHNVQELGKITKTMAGDAFGALGENASEYYEEGMKHAKNLEVSLEEKIKKNPLQSLLIAAGIGLVVGALWRRR